MLSNVKVALFFLISGLFFIPKASLPFKDFLKGMGKNYPRTYTISVGLNRRGTF